MSTFHILKTYSAPPSLFAAGKGVGRKYPLVLTFREYRQHRKELNGLKAQGYITIEEVPDPPAEPVVEEPEPEALAEKPEEVVEVPPEEPEHDTDDGDEPEPEEDKSYDTSLLDQSVANLIKDLAAIDDVAWLDALANAESAGKTRSTALKAITDRKAALEE